MISQQAASNANKALAHWSKTRMIGNKVCYSGMRITVQAPPRACSRNPGEKCELNALSGYGQPAPGLAWERFRRSLPHRARARLRLLLPSHSVSPVRADHGV